MPGILPLYQGDQYYDRNNDLGEAYPPRDRDSMYSNRNDMGDYRNGGYNGSASDMHGGLEDRDHYGSPQISMDHLATFTVGSNQGVLFPEDGIKKLRMMESSSGIWTMRVQMTIETKYLVIVDTSNGSNGEEMERFPLQVVHDPKAFMSNDRKDIFNNLLIFSVVEGDRRTGQSEMHIFQCISKSAQETVDDIAAAKVGRTRSSVPRNVPPPPRDIAPMPLGDGPMHVRSQVRNYEQERQQTQARVREDDLDSNASTDRIDREVQLLNHCFDDIEKFVNRLQMAAEAFKSLQTRQHDPRHKKQQRQRRMGEGLLTMRARPPPPQDFMDVLAKFKLSFNLLAKLKAHIHDPNAPELVHFLFTPLSLIVEASKDNTRYEYDDVPSKVVSPLLSAEAKHLLLNCLTSKETDLWMSLGEAWSVSRDLWKGYVPPYIPRFMDGWQPMPAIVEDREAITAAVNNHAAQIKRQDEANRAMAQADDHVFRYERNQRPDFGNAAYREDMSRRNVDQEPVFRDRDSIPLAGPDPRNRQSHAPFPTVSWEEEQKLFLQEIRSRGGRLVEVIHERTGNNAKELTIKRGEVLEVMDSSRNWWKMKNSKGVLGHAPYTMLKEITNELDDRNGGPVPVRYDSFDAGHVPMRERPSSGHYNHSLPPPPPPAPALPPPTQQNIYRNPRKEEQDKKNRWSNWRHSGNVDDLNNELKKTLSMGNGIRNGNGVSRTPRTPTVYITRQSTAEEVKDWLASKGFNHRIVYAFEDQTGKDMFSLTKGQLERICGYDDGQRLFSQITVQKNLSGYGTTGASELHAILQRRKVRADSFNEQNEHPMPDLPAFHQPKHRTSENYGVPPDYAPDDDLSDDSADSLPDGSKTLKAMLRKRRKEILK